jgi:hypothetical protein
MLKSSRESGLRARFDGYQRRRGSKAHRVVDTVGHLLSVHVTSAVKQERTQIDPLCAAVQQAMG